jgi:hypothetical protein
LAFTPPGAPATWICGETDGLGLAEVADPRGAAVVASLAAGLAWSPAVADEQAVAPTATTAASETIPFLSRTWSA